MNPILQDMYDTFLRELRQLRSEEADILLQSKRSVDAGIRVVKELR